MAAAAFEGPCNLPGSGPPPEDMLDSGNHTAAGTMPIWEACATLGVMVTSGPKLLLMAMTGSMVLLQMGSVMMSIAHINTEAHLNYMLK